MKHLVYLGNVFHIENEVITITPMKSTMEAIQKLLGLLPQLKACKSFCKVVELSQPLLQRFAENTQTNI